MNRRKEGQPVISAVQDDSDNHHNAHTDTLAESPHSPSSALLEARAAADVHSGPLATSVVRRESVDAGTPWASLAELKTEYDAFRASTAELLAELRAEVCDRDATIVSLRAELCDDDSVRRLANPSADHLKLAEAALERERAAGVSLRMQLQTEQAKCEALRKQLERSEAEQEVTRAAEGALRLELQRLRASCASSAAADEYDRNNTLAEALADSERRCAAATSLSDRLAADNSALTEILNTQAALLDAVRRAQHEHEEQRAGRTDAVSSPIPDRGLMYEPAETDEAQHHRRHQRPQTLAGAIWYHIAGYDDAPQGQVLLDSE